MLSAQVLMLDTVQRTGIALIQNLVEQAKQPRNRAKALLVLWVLAIFLLLVVTAISIYGLYRFTFSYKPGVVVSTILWAFFFGACALFFLPSRLITTLFGSILGISVNEVGTASGLLTKANETITGIANQMNVIVNGQDHSTDPFISWMIWIFVIILALICLPAFFSKQPDSESV